ncbi:MAG TPA: ferrous iron transport protein B [Longimicrobiales bacterium]|nr:ferrous iron transport protein B [Longimicrobiales bacterium]
MSTTLTRTPEHRHQNLVRLGLSPDRWDYLVALAGNPNVGKTTVFNALTGLRQHTGNWPGKTVARAEGAFAHRGRRVKVVDLPGTYSLQAGSADEEVARDFILFGRPDVTVVVVDATRLERNLNLVLQILEITDRVVVCLNLVDEARRHGIVIDDRKLARELGVPVVPAVARSGEGMDRLLNTVEDVALRRVETTPFRLSKHAPEVESAVAELVPGIERAFPRTANPRWVALRLLNGDTAVEEAVRSGELGFLHDGPGAAAPATTDEAAATPVTEEATAAGGAADVLELASRLRWELRPDFHDALMERLYAEAERIAGGAQERSLRAAGARLDARLDAILTSRVWGFPLMLVMLAAVFWITIEGSNVPSQMLATLLVDTVHPWLQGVGEAMPMPWWLSGFLFDGVYLATAWVVSVMLPPMAIFFPLFTLLEDFGYLPRVAFNLDSMFQRVGAHGKQALTMSMGFGCNAAGVVSTRVIDSPRERLIAILTNNFSLCNGRWPTQILIASIFIGALAPAHLAGLVSAAAVVGIAVLGIGFMFLSSWLLSRTVLRGEASTFSLELPPYRPPRVLQTLYTSIIDRTLIVLWRAVVFAIPAGAVIWLSGNITVGGTSVAEHLVGWLDPLGILIGLNGVILLAFVVAIPANEIVIPTVLMLTALVLGSDVGAGAGVMFELDSDMAIADLLRAGGWTLLTGVCLMLFSLLHNPCSTTIYTIYRETGSARWTAVATLMPLAMGLVVCFLVAQVWRVLA